MTETLRIQPTGPIHGSIRPPGSKSITNRALVCAALAEGESTLRGALDSEDTRVMTDSLGRLGIRVTADPQARTLHVVGCGGRIPVDEAHLFVANSGTTIRFLTAMVALGEGAYRLDGTERMRERPIGDLAKALKQLGADVTCESPGDCPPVVVKAHGLRGRASIAGNISSQYLSGLLMAIPCAQGPVELTVEGKLVSTPYLNMTLTVMGAFAVDVEHLPTLQFRTEGRQAYRPMDYSIEPDASAASYFFAAAAITGGEVTVEGLSESSLQGDVAFCQCLDMMGCTVRYGADSITVKGKAQWGINNLDMNAISDTVQTLAAVALFAKGPTRVINVAHIRHKETDRISALVTELRKLGAEVDEFPDGLRITPGSLHAAEIETYDDHRMAMSLALVGLQTPGVVIRDPGCTAKTYPEFFQDLKRLAGS